MLEGIAGIVIEPVKGGKKQGAKGVAKGLGRGIIGIVAKPIAGTVGFFQCTVQGTVNTPGTIKRSFNNQPVNTLQHDLVNEIIRKRESEIEIFRKESKEVNIKLEELSRLQEKDTPEFEQKLAVLLDAGSSADHIR